MCCTSFHVIHIFYANKRNIFQFAKEFFLFIFLPTAFIMRTKIKFSSLCFNFFHLLAQKSKLEKSSIYQTNSFIIFTYPNPVLLVPCFGQVGKRKHCNSWLADYMKDLNILKSFSVFVVHTYLTSNPYLDS